MHISRLQELSKHMYKEDHRWMLQFREKMEQAKRYVKFCTEVYKYQRKNGKDFLHEHPWLATSLDLECTTKIKNMEDVRIVQTHTCANSA